MRVIIFILALGTLASFLNLAGATSDPYAQCRAPAKTGNGKAAFKKWHYDMKEKKCKEFTWGGKDGNDNRFDSEDECKKKCGGLAKSEQSG